MADETKKYLINVESNLPEYAKQADEARKRVEQLKIENENLKKSGTATTQQIEKSNGALRVAQQDYKNLQKSVENATRVNKAEVGSYEQLYQAWKNAQTQLKLMGGAYTVNEKGVRELSQRYIEQSKIVGDAKRALDSFGKGVNDNRLNVGNYTESIKTAMGQMQAMPGPLGTATSAVKGFGSVLKGLIANPIVAFIAGITAALVGLFKIFKSTAEGGGKIKDLFASIGGILNELRARVVSFIDVFQNIFSGDWKAVGESVRETFGGLGESLGQAAENAKELSRQQRALTKDLAMHISEEANEINKIQEYLFLAKDKSKTDQERLNYLKESLRLGKEQAEREVEFAKRQWEIDVATAANKAKIDKQVLADWVAMDQEAQLEMLNNRKDIQEAYNLIGGSKALEALEQSYSKQIEAQTEFFAHNKRAISQASSLENEMLRDREEKYKAHTERMQKIQDDNIKLMTLEAGKDVEKRKAALKAEYDYEIQQKGLSNTEKKILEIEYRNAVSEIDQQAVKESQALLQKEVDDYKKSIEEKKNADIKFRQEIADFSAQDDAAKFEYQRIQYEGNLNALEQILDQEYQALLGSVEYEQMTFNQRILAETQYNKTKQDLANSRIAIQQMELNAVGNLMGTLSGLFGKQTVAAKLLSVAQATISTYTAGVKAMAELPLGSGPILRLATLASIIAAGLIQVKNILAVKVPGGGGGSAPAPTAISGSQPAQRITAQQVGSTFLTQPNLTQQQVNTLPSTPALTAQDIADAMAKIPAPIVTVEDINARTESVRKVEVRATI